MSVKLPRGVSSAALQTRAAPQGKNRRKLGPSSPLSGAKKNLRAMSAAWKICLLGVSAVPRFVWRHAPKRLAQNNMHRTLQGPGKFA